MLDINLLPFDAVFTLVGDIDDTSTNPDVTLTWAEDNVGPYIEEEGQADVLVTELMVTGSAQFANTGGAEAFYMTGGVISTTQTRQITFNTIKRGIPNGDGANPPTQTESTRYREHKEGKVWLVSETTVVKDLNSTFEAATTNETVTAGEALDSTSAALSISRHTDTKYYKYHGTNYPNLQGVLEKGQTITIDTTFTLVNLKGTTTAHTGLTAGARYFAEDTGALTVTESATTEFIGKARTTTILDHALSAPPMTIASQAEAEAGTDNTKVMSPLRTVQAIAANSTDYIGPLGEVKQFALSLTGAVTKATLQSNNWAICDGTTPAAQGISTPTITTTPDLQDKFIRMSNDETSGTTGGNDAHVHQWAGTGSYELPRIGADNTGGTSQATNTSKSFNSSGTLISFPASTDGLIGSYYTDSQDNVPAYYELVYFLKVK